MNPNQLASEDFVEDGKSWWSSGADEGLQTTGLRNRRLLDTSNTDKGKKMPDWFHNLRVTLKNFKKEKKIKHGR